MIDIRFDMIWYMLIHVLIHGSKKCHVNVTRLGQVLVEEEAMVFRSLHGFLFWNGFSWPWWSWWNILEYFRLDHIGSHDVTHHTSHTESYWVILSHTESYWVILSHTVISIHIRHHITHHITSVQINITGKVHHVAPFLADPCRPMVTHGWESGHEVKLKCLRSG